MHFTKNDLKQTERIKRLNIVNSVAGVKPGNLIGTTSAAHGSNLAIFSSIVHLCSNPGLLGFLTRSTDADISHTYSNILENKCFTVNHIHENFIEQAHFTSAKFERGVSEFEHCSLTEEFLFDFPAPFVKESLFKIALRYVETVEVKSSGTCMVVGEIQHLIFPDECMAPSGMIDLALVQSVGIAGLNRYYSVKKMAEFPYARENNLPSFGK